MERLKIDDLTAEKLIDLLKMFVKKYNIDLSPGNKGCLELSAHDYTYDFLLNYYTPKHRDDKISIHLREKDTNYHLIRINIDDVSFHKNSNGEKIEGNRILIFSNTEWMQKNDGHTHTKAYPLPEVFKDISNLEQVFLDFLVYINVKKEEKIFFNSYL